MPSSDPDSRVTQLKLIHDDVERKVDSYQARLEAMSSRAGVLVAAAGVAATLVTAGHRSGWLILCAIALFASAAFGIAVLWPRTGKSISGGYVRHRIYGMSEGEALLWLIDHKLWMLGRNEARVVQRARYLQIGFGCFAAAIVFALVASASAG